MCGYENRTNVCVVRMGKGKRGRREGVGEVEFIINP
jgi:hypothetical protein